MIAIIDYDMGNLKSVSKALESLGAEVCITRDIRKIKDASKIILPGVGAFPQCMKNLEDYKLIETVISEVQKGKFFLGICLGLQLLFEESVEKGGSKGLGLLKGKVLQFNLNKSYKVPHMGWNQIEIKKPNNKLYKNISDQSSFYFVHSFYVKPDDESIIATETNYGTQFCSSIIKDNIWACQFHPEKSQNLGLKLLENFININ